MSERRMRPRQPGRAKSGRAVTKTSNRACADTVGHARQHFECRRIDPMGVLERRAASAWLRPSARSHRPEAQWSPPSLRRRQRRRRGRRIRNRTAVPPTAASHPGPTPPAARTTRRAFRSGVPAMSAAAKPAACEICAGSPDRARCRRDTASIANECRPCGSAAIASCNASIERDLPIPPRRSA